MGNGNEEAYNWYDFVLNDFGQGYNVEEAGEVELGGRLISETAVAGRLE